MITETESIPYKNWDVRDQDSFLFKAKQNLLFAECARSQKQFDIEANRLYFALHQLACELVRLGKMTIRTVRGTATAGEPWRLGHGTYDAEIKECLKIEHSPRVYGAWRGFRRDGDYNYKRIGETTFWKTTSERRRKQAIEIAESIYEKLCE